MHSDFRLIKGLREFTKHYPHSETKLMEKANAFLRIKIFHQLSKIVQRFLRGSGVVETVSQLNIIRHRVYELTRLMVANAYDIKGVVLVTLFDKLEKFAVVLKGSVYTLEPVAINRIRQRKGYLYLNGFVLIIKVGIKTLR